MFRAGIYARVSTLDQQTLPLQKRALRPFVENLREVSASERGEFFIHVSAQSVPGINLSAATLHVLKRAELSLDVDIILYASEET